MEDPKCSLGYLFQPLPKETFTQIEEEEKKPELEKSVAVQGSETTKTFSEKVVTENMHELLIEETSYSADENLTD